MDSFEDLGISPELLDGLAAEGFEIPTPFQRAAIPVLRKGNHLLANAGPGAGTLAAYGVALLEAVDGEARSPHSLVLVPSRESGLRLARSLSRLAQFTGHRIAALGSAWALPELASILFGTPGDMISAVRTSSIAMGDIQIVVVDGFSSVPSQDREALEVLLEAAPKGGQRVLLSQPLTAEAEAFAAAHLQKAVHIPPRAAQTSPETPPRRGSVTYRVTGEDKEGALLDTVAALLQGGLGHVLIFFRTDDQAADMGDLLALHGYLSGPPGDPAVPVWLAVEELEALRGTKERSGEASVGAISYDVPSDPDSLDRRHRGHEPGVILVRPREIPHLKDVGRRTGYGLAPISEPIPTTVAGEMERLRGQLRRALQEEDLAPLYLMLEPLFDSFSPGEVAAAALALLRRRDPDVRPLPLSEVERPDEAQPKGSRAKAWVRLFVSVGERDGVGPGDLLGAIAGEAGLEGSRVGKIEIRDTFSLVEVSPDEAEAIIRAVNGTTIRGRSARVDFDRGGPRGRSPAQGRGGPRRKIRRDPRQER
jgi:ATP-dependent RNA helicase DeaD